MTNLGRRLGMGAAGAVIVVVAWFAWRGRKPAPPPPPPYAFDMCVTHAPPPGPAPHPQWNDAVLAAVARTLSPEERASLEEALNTSAVRWEAKANPVLEDLEGGDPDAPVIAWFKKGPSFLRTAQASSRLRECTPDGTLCIRPRAKGAACPEGWTAPASADEDDRARFIQWSWGHALRFSGVDGEQLRQRVPASKAIAVVMTADDAEVTKKDPYAVMRERWGKIAALKRAARHERGASPTTGFVVDIAPSDVIVLPRHDAMSQKAPDDIVSDEVTGKTRPRSSSY